jgi:hypothetical protein
MDFSRKDYRTTCMQLFTPEQIIIKNTHEEPGSPSYRLALIRAIMWDNGSTLRVRFLGGSEYLKRKVCAYINLLPIRGSRF